MVYSLKDTLKQNTEMTMDDLFLRVRQHRSKPKAESFHEVALQPHTHPAAVSSLLTCLVKRCWCRPTAISFFCQTCRVFMFVNGTLYTLIRTVSRIGCTAAVRANFISVFKAFFLAMTSDLVNTIPWLVGELW